MKRACPYCNTEFEAQRKDKNYCSPSCRQQSYMMRKGAALMGSEVSLIQNVNPSSDASENKNDVSDDALPIIENVIEEKPIANREYKWMSSSFVEHISNLLRSRNNAYELHVCSREYPALNKSIEWINVRLRCLIEATLTLSERSSIDLKDLVDVTNAFTMIIQSDHYKQLPEVYPYRQDIKRFRDKLKAVCLDNEGADDLTFNIKKEIKIELIAMRCELRTVAKKKSFNQLEFKETKTKETCKTNHHREEKTPLKQWQINYQNIKTKNNQ